MSNKGKQIAFLSHSLVLQRWPPHDPPPILLHLCGTVDDVEESEGLQALDKPGWYSQGNWPHLHQLLKTMTGKPEPKVGSPSRPSQGFLPTRAPWNAMSVSINQIKTPTLLLELRAAAGAQGSWSVPHAGVRSFSVDRQAAGQRAGLACQSYRRDLTLA